MMLLDEFFHLKNFNKEFTGINLQINKIIFAVHLKRIQPWNFFKTAILF